MKSSVKIKLSLIMMGLVAGLVILVSIINAVFFEKYYINNKVDELKTTFYDLCDLVDNYNSKSDITAYINNIRIEKNINILVADSGIKTLYSSQSDFDSTESWLKKNIFSPNMQTEILSETEQYIVQKSYNEFDGRKYLEIIGTNNDSRYYVLLQVSVDTINDNIAITNKFFVIAGIIAMLIAGVLAYVFASGFTKPIKQLSKTAEAMSEMNFDVKYTGKSNDEIGLLGKSINSMSDSLEKYITDLKVANLELQKDIEKKNEIDAMRKDFISNVSHELKTPIALIQGYAEGLKDGVSDDPESMEYYCDVIIDESSKMNKMVRQLLDLNQLESGRNPIEIERFDITKLIADVVNSNRMRAQQKSADIIFNETEVVNVWADEFKIEEVITNYLTNAINHVEKVNDKEPEIHVFTEKKDSRIRVHVYNTGKNIPDESINHVWDKFYKVDKARTRAYGGSGIGLSIVKAIMMAHSQNFGVDNTLDGVDFWFELDCGNK